MPDVNVIVPAHNAEATIRRCLHSILRQQWRGEVEVVVVDDGSTDGTAAVVEDLARGAPRPVRLVRQDNAGAGRARNRGAEEARAPLVTFLDADDIWLPGLLATCASAYERYRPDAVLAGFVVMDGGGERTEVLSADILRRAAEPLDEPCHRLVPAALGVYLAGGEYFGNDDTLLIGREAFFEVGGFPEEFPVGEDMLLWLRMLTRLRLVYVARALARVFVGEGTRSRADMEHTWANIVAILRRFRAEAPLPRGARRATRRRLGGARMSLAVARWRKGKRWFPAALRGCLEGRHPSDWRMLASMCLGRGRKERGG